MREGSKEDRFPNNFALSIDTLIFIMIHYSIVEIIGRKSVAMSALSYRLERTDFVFTRRT